MTEGSGHLSEEPQEERGAPGSRDVEGPEGQQTDRPAGTSDADDHTGVDPQDAGDGASTMQTGDGG